MSADERIEESRRLYERAILTGDASALTAAELVLDAVEADLALARGRVIHGRFLAQRNEDPEQAKEDPRELPFFERSAQLYHARGDVLREAEALFWVGCFHQVVRHDDATAVPVLERSLQLAAQVGDKPTMSEALRHLGIAARRAGRLDEARQHLEESVRLRREIGMLAGVAANLVGLIYIAIEEGRRSDALALIDEALATAEASGADAVIRQIEEASAQL